MKQALALVCLAAMLLGLAACGNPTPPETNDPDEDRISVIIASLDLSLPETATISESGTHMLAATVEADGENIIVTCVVRDAAGATQEDMMEHSEDVFLTASAAYGADAYEKEETIEVDGLQAKKHTFSAGDDFGTELQLITVQFIYEEEVYLFTFAAVPSADSALNSVADGVLSSIKFITAE